MKPQTMKVWIEAIWFGLALVLFSILYQYLQTRTVTIFTFEFACSFAGIILINLSFILSGLSYFWRIGIRKLGHRKQYGVVGFVLVLIHAVLSLQLYAGGILSLSLYRIAPLTYISPLIALVIFTMMVGVSNWDMPARLGAILWRKLLRVGYIAIVLFMIHVTLLRYTTWINWFETLDPLLPPQSLFLFLFSVTTLGLRIALFFALRKKTSHNSPS
ncbi:MAG: hypothetical protein UU81_C0010G0012 [Microgenomates group bacterium GW2011_GWC1_41_8]|uniref:Ferric oxidoreductase domain-containing protein n=3 Tax=Candidatus Roizmaniibacteriota TaxID=1752723 RepID=A0A0G0X976_9BACT|nr:MAG: hypothetical protein UU14_C0003G0030 [Candidatus Roizmanbacteria bacterium GW2011_GWB1_40_7]KKR91631.1 MAG: hypothetical protein UU41_C0034G0015 [Candidatus Roizmanbacteria bacterium GW2011_GWA1_41_13]KKS21500.1 MAG: hypothetical protein UU78_C0037G0011 [Candidatus Roizmanbacteria bacterium GW2011_GWC2_41_7]KKS24229.1 MAG: hypothetical protein UU81_C0010G0012 [Microgenomates group bacterium GW2011_GWC1_41_8]OGK49785.1 MAG: hypothetical protein A3A55_03490 [Candidatus Roizmanbacteria bac